MAKRNKATEPKKCKGASWWCGKPTEHTIKSPDGNEIHCCSECKEEWEGKVFPALVKKRIEIRTASAREQR